MTLTEVGFCTAAGPVVAVVGTDCGYCRDDPYTTVIPEEWSGARKLIVCRRCGEITELGCWPDPGAD